MLVILGFITAVLRGWCGYDLDFGCILRCGVDRCLRLGFVVCYLGFKCLIDA